jgi:hypothetical protein
MEWRRGGVAVAGTDSGSAPPTGVPEKGLGLRRLRAAARSIPGVTTLVICDLALRLQGAQQDDEDCGGTEVLWK